MLCHVKGVLMFVSEDGLAADFRYVDIPMRNDPRADMAARLPAQIQPFLSWLTAKPAPGEEAVPRRPTAYVIEAVMLVLLGCVLSVLALTWFSIGSLAFWPLLAGGLLATTSGLGIFQVVIFHHCSHGTVFPTRQQNRFAGRLVSAILLFKHFDAYAREHMVHHNANKLFTMEDEYTDFVVNICDFSTSHSRGQLWRRLLVLLVSPAFHMNFMNKRVRGSLRSPDRRHNLLGISVWSGLFLAALAGHMVVAFCIAWVLPVTVLLQIATVFRILCEHRLPAPEVIAGRGRNLVCQSTAGVFAGMRPPARGLTRVAAASAWAMWWANMLIVQMFVRLFVLVGDAPCHDFHHRRPGKRWTDYSHARQADLESGCPGFPLNYVDTWGLFRAVDENFIAMAAAPADVFGL